MANEEILFKLSMLEQQAQEMKQQIESVDLQIRELESLKLSLEKLNENPSNEMLAPIGRGIFVKAELKEKDLFVNVGSNVIVKRTCNEAGEILTKQIEEISKIKRGIENNIGEIESQFLELVNENKLSQ
jgi:prefoldin alpha subunit